MALRLTPSRVGPGELGGEALALLAQALLAVRTTGDLGTASTIAGLCAQKGLEASEYRVLRLDPRSGALRILDESGVETPYLAEHGGPIEWVMRNESPWWDEGAGQDVPRETLLWNSPAASAAVLPLAAGGTTFGFLMLAFDRPHLLDAAQRLFLQTLGDALALALERLELRREAEEARRALAEMERQTEDDEESSSRLMSVVAHEIRSPLTAIKAYTEALLDSLSNPSAPRERFLGIINDECDRLSRLVTDILDLSKLEAGQRPLRLSGFEVAPLLKETLDGLAPVARGRQVTFDLRVPGGLVIEADADLIRRLVINLVGNAVKFSPRGGVVTIRAEQQGDGWTCTVEDQGPGIPAEDLPRVFERFFRSRASGGQEIEGTGLGLAISRGIVELHGGRIGVRSLEPRGSRFDFTLPLRQLASSQARRIARQVWKRNDLRELFGRTVEMIAAAMDAGIVSLMFVDPDRGDLFIAASHGLEGYNLAGRRTAVRSGVAGSVAAWGKPLLVDNIETDRRFQRLNHPQYRTKSLLCVPLRLEGEVLGVFNVNNKHDGNAFDDDDLAVLAALVERIGSAVERALAHPDSPRVVSEALEAVRAITRLKRDCLLGGHDLVRRARATGRALSMSPQEVDAVGYAASIHDLGMTRLQHRVSRPQALSEELRRELHTHPEISVEIIRPLEYLGSVREIVLSHHERWDGQGYPRRLGGEEIPLGARVLAVGDAYESMTRGRPYRPALPSGEAIAELRREAGAQFDPVVVEAFVGVVEREETLA